MKQKAGFEVPFGRKVLPYEDRPFRRMFRQYDAKGERFTKDCKWWSADEIRNSSEVFFMDNLAEELTKIINGEIPEEPVEI